MYKIKGPCYLQQQVESGSICFINIPCWIQWLLPNLHCLSFGNTKQNSLKYTYHKVLQQWELWHKMGNCDDTKFSVWKLLKCKCQEICGSVEGKMHRLNGDKKVLEDFHVESICGSYCGNVTHERESPSGLTNKTSSFTDASHYIKKYELQKNYMEIWSL